MPYPAQEQTVKESVSLLLDLAAEFFDEAADQTETLRRAREIEALRRRAAIRLVPNPKMGFEVQYWTARQMGLDL